MTDIDIGSGITRRQTIRDLRSKREDLIKDWQPSLFNTFALKRCVYKMNRAANAGKDGVLCQFIHRNQLAQLASRYEHVIPEPSIVPGLETVVVGWW